MTRIHLSLRTTDLEAATAFYAKLLRTEPDKVHDDYVRFAPADIPILLALMPGTGGVDHFGLRFDPESVVPTFDAMQAVGLPVSPSENVVCCHAEKHETWLRDPDGLSWEVYAVTDEAPKAAAPDPSACCP